MKFLAIERDVPGVPEDAMRPQLRAEAAQAWRLHQAGIVRELYFRADAPAAVLILECADAAEAQRALRSLPLARQNLIAFDVLPLVAYPGFARLFAEPLVGGGSEPV